MILLFKLVMLREHFRCVPDIIEFSNELCYGGRIKPLRAADSTPVAPPFALCRTDGVRDEKDRNLAEADAIARLMKGCLSLPEYEGKTFGAIVMRSGSSESRQIRAVMEAVNREIPAAEQEKRRFRVGLSKDFQGDERDVIFLSLVDSPLESGMLRKESAENATQKKRWNVAVSRAKDQVWIVHSFDPKTQLQPGDLRLKLFEHAEASALGRAAEARIAGAADPNSQAFEAPVAIALAERGYEIEQQVPAGGFRIDIVVAGEGGRVALECDGERWHSGPSAIIRDMSRQRVLERVGWTFLRLRGSEYFRDPAAAIDRICASLRELGVEPLHAGRQTARERAKALEARVLAAAAADASADAAAEAAAEAAEPSAAAPQKMPAAAAGGALEGGRPDDADAAQFAAQAPDAEADEAQAAGRAGGSAQEAAAESSSASEPDLFSALEEPLPEPPEDGGERQRRAAAMLDELLEAGWRTKDIADAAGISGGYPSLIRNGRSRPSKAVFLKIERLWARARSGEVRPPERRRG